MSQESLTWLNNNVLVGFTDKRGAAWHYRKSEQGTEPNHYPQAVPVGDVLRRLFDWQAIERELFIQVPCDAGDLTQVDGLDASGQPYQIRPVPNRKAIVTSDTHDVLGVFADGYQPHQYRQWLLDTVATILDAELGIGSAGLLRNRAQAWVSVEVPENVVTPSGVVFRPNLLACTSLDGSMATTFKRTATAVVCDNTLAVGLRGAGQHYKVKHSRYSGLKIAEARDALSVVYGTADDFSAEVEKLIAEQVTPAEWAKVLDALVPVPAETGRSRTMAEAKRDKLVSLYTHDNRVAPWAGTSFGVLQAFNTYNHHEGIVRGTGRAERNMSNALLGITEAADEEVLKTLAAVTERDAREEVSA